MAMVENLTFGGESNKLSQIAVGLVKVADSVYSQ